MTISRKHTSVIIIVRQYFYFVGLFFYILICINIIRIPSFWLIWTGKHKDQLYMGVYGFQLKNCLCGKGVKAARTACAEIGYAAVYVR